jgi:dipeptidyl aminopeptidase/acylaminoacyl peptidase
LNDSEAALERAKEFSLAGVAGRITCPVLVMHGANDRVVPLEAAHELYAALTTKKKTLKIFTAEEGGAEHCQVDNRPLGISYIADWVAANL